MIYQIIERMSYDGRSNRNNVTNVHYMQTGIPLASADWSAAVASMVNQRKAVSLASLHFMDVRVTELLNDNHTPANGEFRTFVQAGVGGRAVVGAEVNRANCLIINRTSGSGRVGRIMLRGSLLESDVSRTTDGSIILQASAAGNAASLGGSYASQLMAISLQGSWVIPRPRRQQTLPARVVSTMSVGSVRALQRSSPKSSIESARANVAQREINQLASRVRKAQRDTPNWANIVDVANFIGNIAAAVWQIFNALPLMLRGQVTIPRVILALGA